MTESTRLLPNFLSEEELENLFFILSHQEFPWYHIKSVTDETIKVKNATFYPGGVLRHGFFVGQKQSSDMVGFLYPLLDRLCAVVNSKEIIIQNLYCNLLLVNTEGIGKHNYPHIDAEYSEEVLKAYMPYTGIFYPHDSDGDTIFYKKSKEGYIEDFRIKPERNKFAYWPSNTYHSAPVSASTDRYVININFLVPR